MARDRSRGSPRQLGLKMEDFLSVGAVQRMIGSEDLNPGDRFALIIYATLALLVLFIVYSSYSSPSRVKRRQKEELKVRAISTNHAQTISPDPYTLNPKP